MQAEFRFDPSDRCLTDDDLAKMRTILDASGLPHHFAHRRIHVEGSWDEVMRAVRRCRVAISGPGEAVVTTVILDERTPASAAEGRERTEDRMPLADMDVQC